MMKAINTLLNLLKERIGMIDKRIEVATSAIEKNAFIKKVLAKDSSNMHIKFTEEGAPIFNPNFGPLPSYFVSQSYFFIIKSM